MNEQNANIETMAKALKIALTALETIYSDRLILPELVAENAIKEIDDILDVRVKQMENNDK